MLDLLARCFLAVCAVVLAVLVGGALASTRRWE
jgi:hypothetical protein